MPILKLSKKISTFFELGKKAEILSLVAQVAVFSFSHVFCRLFRPPENVNSFKVYTRSKGKQQSLL